MKLKDKVTIITGGAGGIGQGLARGMAKEGAIVVIVDQNEKDGQQVAAEVQKISPQSMFLKADLMDRERLPQIVETVAAKYGQLDILVNNAHASRQAKFEEITQDDMDLSFGTGFYPTFYLMKAAFPYLKKTKGSVINLASGAGLEGQKTQTAYAAAKEAIRAISKVAANEWGQYGINVNIISPIVNSAGVEAWAKAYPKMYQQVLAGIPLGRWGDPEKDIAPAVIFLASDDASYITGQTLMVDGGSIQIR